MSIMPPRRGLTVVFGVTMIHKLALSNFYCVRDHVEIDLSVSGRAPDRPERLAEVATGTSKRVPKVVALYGPNASGKSTVLRALSFISWFIEEGFSLGAKSRIPCHRFNSTQGRSSPLSLELEFDAPANLTTTANASEPRCRYIYSLTLTGGEDEPTQVQKESLAYWPVGSIRRVSIFERESNEVVSGQRSFALQGFTKPIKKILRSNVSLITTLAQLGHDQSTRLRDIAGEMESNIFLEIHEFPEEFIARQYLNNKPLLASLNQEVLRLDLGIKEINIEPPASDRNYPNPRFFHKGLISALSVTSESHGTRQFFKIFPMISHALERGGVAVIDELDSSIHPLILPEIIRWFYDPERNPKNAQIWFTCQNPHLLQELSKDEILFCEKDTEGGTTVFGLNEITGVRRVDNYMKKYLGGAYGAVPHIG